jgi:hypothetical protein
MTVKGYVGAGFKIVIALVVIAFLGLKSLDFFYFVTPADEFYYAYLGFGLTGGGVIAYLVIFLWDATTALKKAVAIGMLLFCVLGELVTAGFGLQINAWKAGGYQLTPEQFRFMVLAIQVLGFAHAAALILYVAGDPIIWAFQDEDGDGTPNALDPVDNRTGEATKGPSILSLFRKKKTAPAVVQNNSVVGQLPQIRMDNFSQEQLLEIAKHIAAISAANQAHPVNGNGAADPTKAAPSH